MKGDNMTFTNFKLLNDYCKRHPILLKNSSWDLIAENGMTMQLGTNIK